MSKHDLHVLMIAQDHTISSSKLDKYSLRLLSIPGMQTDVVFSNALWLTFLLFSSSDLWIITDQCQTSECKSNPMYPLSTYASPSFRSVNNNQTAFNISFADSTRMSVPSSICPSTDIHRKRRFWFCWKGDGTDR